MQASAPRSWLATSSALYAVKEPNFFMLIPLRWLLLSCACLVPGASTFAFSSKAPAPASGLAGDPTAQAALASPPSPDALSLNEVSRGGKTGFDLEPADSREKLLLQARSFARISKGLSTATEEQRFAKFCASNREAPFCAFAADPDFNDLRVHRLPRRLHSTLSRKYVASVSQALREGDTAFLKSVPEGALRQAFRSLDSYATAAKLGEKILASPEACVFPQAAVALAGKAEESLPDPVMRRNAIKLYAKAEVCGDTDSAARASYRGALLNIWADDCAAALPSLDRVIAKSGDSGKANFTGFLDYRARALFWRSHCAAGDSSAAARLELQQKYPFTVHNLLVNQPDLASLRNLSPKTDTWVRLRSSKSDVANQKLLAIEALQKADEGDVARRAVDDLAAESDALEPEVRIYVAVLLGRAEDHIPKFRLLGSLFRENPALISRATLELFYPFRELKQHMQANSLVSESLLLSLIRQESAFNLRARSPAGAMGLMQLMPGTARKFGHFGQKSDLFLPEANVRIGARYFSYLIDRYAGDVELALAAYNAGPKRVDDWMKRYPVASRVLFLDLIPFKETRDYVVAIARNYYWYRALYSEDQGSAPWQADLSKTFRVFSRTP